MYFTSCLQHFWKIVKKKNNKITVIFISDFLTKIHYKVNSLQKIIVYNYLIMIS